jgi:ribosomal protein S12 methylthiotransferase
VESILNRLRKELPDAIIRTTLIAGHPGESTEEYTELKDFITSFRFGRMGVFAYSHEEDTYAFNNYSDEVSDDEKEKRVSELMAIQQEISLEFNESLVGKSLKVLIDRSEGEFFIGRTEYDSPEVDQEVLITSDIELKPGDFYNIEIIQSSDFDLFGKPNWLPK